MPVYVWSGATGAANGTSWTDAYTAIATAITASAAGTEYWLASDHTETYSVATIITFKGTQAAPDLVLSINRTGDTLLAGASFDTDTNDDTITVRGNFYMYGVTFDAGLNSTGGGAVRLNDTAAGYQIYDTCDFIARNNSSANGCIGIGQDNDAQSGNYTELKNCDFLLVNNTGKKMSVMSTVRINGGSLLSGFTSTTVFSPFVGKNGVDLIISGFDFSNGPQGLNLFHGANFSRASTNLTVRNCKLPTSWNGSLFANAITTAELFGAMYNCDSGDTNYRIWTENVAGSTKSETTIVRTGGASDGATTLSWKMASNADAEYPTFVVESPEIVRWNETTGSAITVGIEIVHDSQGTGTSSDIQDDEMWMEVQYLGTAGFPLGSFITSRRALRGTAADYTNSGETWTTTGLTTPVKQTMSVTFTPQEKGFIHVKVYLGKASSTVYVDPKLTVT